MDRVELQDQCLRTVTCGAIDRLTDLAHEDRIEDAADFENIDGFEGRRWIGCIISGDLHGNAGGVPTDTRGGAGGAGE